MDALKEADTKIVLWLNQWVGKYGPLDELSELLVSDYFIPVLMALGLLWLWFSARDQELRQASHWAVITAVVALGCANLAVLLINDYYFRARPFTEADLNLFFYRPTDSSFPANPAVLSFALAFAVWKSRRLVGATLLIMAAMWSLSRVYAGVFYLSDVAVGAAIGVTIAYVITFVLHWLEPLPTMVIRIGKTLHLA